MNNLSCVIIGAGRVGSSFAFAFHKSNIKVKCIVDINSKSAKNLAKKIGCNLAITRLEKISFEFDFVLISVQDRFIIQIVKDLLRAKINLQRKFIFHTSGALSSDILEPLKRNGAKVFSLHPNWSFANKNDYIDFSEVTCAIESDSSYAINFGKRLCKLLGCKFIVLNKNEKSLYHAFAVLISNYSVFLLEEINEHFQNKQILSSFITLLKSTLTNVELYNPANSLTGPIVRGDLKTIKQNLIALKKINNQLAQVYMKIGSLILKKFDLSLDKEILFKLEKIFKG